MASFKTLFTATEGLYIALTAKTRQPIPERNSGPRIHRIKERLDWITWRQMYI